MSSLSDLTPAAYLVLDASIRNRISPAEWAWMTDGQKATLERDELEPDH